MELDRIASNVLREAAEQEIFSALLPSFDEIDAALFDYALDHYEPADYTVRDQQWMPETQHYREHGWPLYATNVENYNLIELAQIAVPSGSVGFLKSIEQYIMDADSDFYPTSSEYWGRPTVNDADINNIRWFLRLSDFNGQLPPRLIVSSAVGVNLGQMPGYPYPELSEFRDIWYPPHCAARFPNLLIPGGSVLRFFYYSPPTTTWDWSVLGRLRIVQQSVLCKEALANARGSAW